MSACDRVSYLQVVRTNALSGRANAEHPVYKMDKTRLTYHGRAVHQARVPTSVLVLVPICARAQTVGFLSTDYIVLVKASPTNRRLQSAASAGSVHTHLC